MVRLALYQPDIPQNVGAMIRLCACLDVTLDIIGPCGFVWDRKKIRRSGMDYVESARYERHDSWNAFRKAQEKKRIILMTTRGDLPYTDFKFHGTDVLLAGRESAGVPGDVYSHVDGRVFVPMRKNLRSLNISTASAMILGEALRQTRWQSKKRT